MADTAKRDRLDSLTAWVHAEVDQLTGDATVAGSIAQMSAEITTLSAVTNRTVAQNARLDNLRDARADARRWVRLARLALLLDGSRARTADLTGADG